MSLTSGVMTCPLMPVPMRHQSRTLTRSLGRMRQHRMIASLLIFFQHFRPLTGLTATLSYHPTIWTTIGHGDLRAYPGSHSLGGNQVGASKAFGFTLMDHLQPTGRKQAVEFVPLSSMAHGSLQVRFPHNLWVEQPPTEQKLVVRHWQSSLSMIFSKFLHLDRHLKSGFAMTPPALVSRQLEIGTPNSPHSYSLLSEPWFSLLRCGFRS